MRFDYFEMLSGEPIAVAGVGHLRSPKLKEISPGGIGNELYSVYLNFLSWGKDEFLKYDTITGVRGVDKLQKAKDRLTVFDIVALMPMTREAFRGVLSFFIVEAIVWGEDEMSYVVLNEKNEVVGRIARDNFEEVRKMILNMNYIGLDKPTATAKPSTDRARELWEQAQGFLKKQAQSPKKKDRGEYSLGNIVSKVCAIHPSYNLLNVYDLTVFQIYDAFFQIGYLKNSDLAERIFSIHGGDRFRFEDWLKPII